MLCVRDEAFRVEYRVVLFDEKPCCARGCDVYLGYLEVPGQSPPLLWRVLRVLLTTSSRTNGALLAGWGFSSRISCGVVR